MVTAPQAGRELAWGDGEGAFAGLEHLIVLEEGEIGGRMHFWVLKWLKLPSLTSSLLSMVLERLEVNGSSPLREVVFLLPWWLAWGVHHCLCWTLLSL